MMEYLVGSIAVRTADATGIATPCSPSKTANAHRSVFAEAANRSIVPVNPIQTICTELADLGETISYQGPAKLVYRCKPNATTRAVSNLVDNAMKFGTRISVSLSRLGDDGIQIDVADDGPGISYSHRPRVFEPFFKEDSSRRSGGEGFGLGLSIAKRIVESHGGRIELFDCAPRGLRVCISLPPQPARADM